MENPFYVQPSTTVDSPNDDSDDLGEPGASSVEVITGIHRTLGQAHTLLSITLGDSGEKVTAIFAAKELLPVVLSLYSSMEKCLALNSAYAEQREQGKSHNEALAVMVTMMLADESVDSQESPSDDTPAV